MGDHSHIEWTDATWNPLLGCTKCSAGCQHCYAIRTAWRLQHNPNPALAAAYAGLVRQAPDGSLNWTGKINLLPERLQIPIAWKKPRRIFVNSQSDLFHPDVPDEFIDRVFATMAIARQHTFQVLTKRAKRMRQYLSHPRLLGWLCDLFPAIANRPAWPLPNVWMGVSVENQAAADRQIPELIATPAAVRFLSVEPMVGPVDAEEHFEDLVDGGYVLGSAPIHWVICGGESGPGARPMHPDWVRSLRDQCQAAGVPFFFKQWGEFGLIDRKSDNPGCRWINELGDSFSGASYDPPLKERGVSWALMAPLGKHAAGRLLDGRTWDEYPASPAPLS